MITVYTCDIIGSRNYGTADRLALAKAVEAAFADACRLFPQPRADLLSFSVTQGDEFQFHAARSIDWYKFLLYFRTSVTLSKLKPEVFFRSGIGFGEKATHGKNTYQMDGSAYSNSRLALDGFASKENLNKLTRMHTHNKKTTLLLNTILMFCDNLETGWSPEQRQMVHAALQGKTQSQISAELGTTQQNISKILISANWDYLINAFQTINAVI